LSKPFKPTLARKAVGDVQLLRARQAALGQGETDVDAPTVQQHFAAGLPFQPGNAAQQRVLFPRPFRPRMVMKSFSVRVSSLAAPAWGRSGVRRWRRLQRLAVRW
jgi:hypothetical protein